MNVNYERVCRLCLSSRSELLPIFPTTSSDDTEPPVLASKIKDCVSIQITENDDLPTNVCRKCMDNVNNWHIFKSVCERTQNKLQSLINKDGSQLEEVKIKSEPLSDEAYDDGVVIDGSYPDSENASSSKVQPEGPPILASLGLTPRSDKTYIDPRMDWQRVHAILNIVQDDDIIDSLQSTEECDILQHSDHDSESDSELQPDTNDMFIDSKNGYLCKNNKLLSKFPKMSSSLIYSKMREATKLRKRKIDVSKHCSGPKKAWQLLFTDDLLEQIVSSTNCNLAGQGKAVTDPTTIGEIKTLIGVLYLHGIMRPTHQKCSDLWNNELGAACVRNNMKYERFKFLLQNMRFDKDDDSIIQLDIMKRMRKVFEIFAINCRAAFDVQNVVIVDEIIVPVYGPCPFRYEICKKPLKQGIKMVLLMDISNFYVSNLDVITDHYFRGNEILKKLVHHMVGSGKIIIMDSWFTSLDLVNTLKKEYQLYSIAALNPKDENIPPLFLSKYRKTRSLLSGFLDNDICITSYVDTQSKSINILTNEPKFYKRGHVNHTTVVSMYKKNQSAVEVIDVLMHYYTTMQHSNDWTLSLFFTLLNIASVNAQVIWSSQNSHNIVQRRLFIKSLALSLLENEDPILQCSLNDIKYSKMESNISQELLPYYKNRKRCRICIKTLKRDRRTKQCCVKCGQSICREHCVNICTMCVI